MLTKNPKLRPPKEKSSDGTVPYSALLILPKTNPFANIQLQPLTLTH